LGSNSSVKSTGLLRLVVVTGSWLRREGQDLSTESKMPADVLSKLLGSKAPLPNRSPSQIHRGSSAGLTLTRVESKPVSDFHLTVTPNPGETPAALVRRLAAVLNGFGATVVQQIVFGSISAHRQTLAALRQALDDPELPVTWVEGSASNDNPISGMQVHAVTGAEVMTIGQGTTSHGRVWKDSVAAHCVFSALGPAQTALAGSGQTRETFESLQAGLIGEGMGMKDVVRTWFFLNEILLWYGEFNRVRNDFFARSELRPGSVPASTGVSGVNPAGAALTAAAWAVRAHEASTRVVEVVPSPCQCPAPAYGSAFSRAVELHLPGYRQLLVSGTASIEPDGRTAHIGDVRAQIELTMQVVEAILDSRRMSFADVSRATAYFKSGGDAPVFDDWLARRGLRTMPVVGTCCDICREDLLFELELDAIHQGG